MAHALSPGKGFLSCAPSFSLTDKTSSGEPRRPWGSYFPDPSSLYDWPSYDVELLTQDLVALVLGRRLVKIRFYTGVHSPAVDAP